MPSIKVIISGLILRLIEGGFIRLAGTSGAGTGTNAAGAAGAAGAATGNVFFLHLFNVQWFKVHWFKVQ